MTLKSLTHSVIIVGGALLLSACATSTVVGGDPGLTVLPTRELPTPQASDYLSGTRPYLVGPLDRLVVDVFKSVKVMLLLLLLLLVIIIAARVHLHHHCCIYCYTRSAK